MASATLPVPTPSEAASGRPVGPLDRSKHAVRGSHWVRLVSAVSPDPLLLRHVWQAATARVPSIGLPVLPAPDELDAWRRLPCAAWPDIKAKAVASDDGHDISLVFSATEEGEIYGDRLYRVVAARQMGLIT